MSSQPAFRFVFRAYPPIRTIRPGECISVELPDSDGLGPDLKPMPREWFDLRGNRRFPGNPVYGPIYVEGAEPGDALEVRFEQVASNRSVARTLIAPNHGYLPGHLLRDLRAKRSAPRIPKRMILWKLGRTTARISNPFDAKQHAIKLAPFLGCVATAFSRRAPCSLDAGSHGGNIDVSDLQAGATLWLPVSVRGGLLYLGDMHAAQGQGEIVGGALEVSGRVQIRCSVRKHAQLRWPRYQNQHGRGCIVTQRTMDQAVQLAMAEMIQWLTEDGLNRYNAYMLLSQTCAFKLGGINRRSCTLACFHPSR